MILPQRAATPQYRVGYDLMRSQLTEEPIHWEKDPTGLLKEAVHAFYRHKNCKPLMPEHIAVLGWYGWYFMGAPCWSVDPNDVARWSELRERFLACQKCKQLDQCLFDLCDFGLFPFAEERS